nr:hypothetical protein [Treponemataceae bacterium]
DHTCYLPAYCNHFISSTSIKQGCYSETYDDGKNYACFEKVSDCLKHMAYSSDIYAYAATYTKD